jgi:HlyD family secretion protein
MKKLIGLIAVVAVAIGGFGFWYARAGNGRSQFQSMKIERGNLLATISATGTLEPESVVDVGAQVTGRILQMGRDPRDSTKEIDYNSPVEVGTVLAAIDPRIYQTQVLQAQAGLDQARANVVKAEADLIKMRAQLKQTSRDWERARNLGPTRANAISGLDYDTAEAAFKTADSALEVGKAVLETNKKVVAQAEANLKLAQTNLDYCTISSDVKGTIIDRRVNVGQTVNSNMAAPSLFLIAKDLKRMQVWVSVNEADIGQIFEGQIARFTVDAYPDETFEGKVLKMRLNATMTQNVVTYTVEVEYDNSDLRLKPYMTANVRFQVAERKDVLLVPNAALRWRPNFNQIAPDARADYAAALKRKPAASTETADPAAAEPQAPPRTDQEKRDAARSARTKEKKRQEKGWAWVDDHGYVRPIRVKIGLTDGVMTEVIGDKLPEGSSVVVREAKTQDNDAGENPFANKSPWATPKKKE